MTLSGFTLIFEAVFAALLVVTIVYAARLNARISGLRERDGELREMIDEFDRATSQAQESAAALKAAGLDAERQLKAAIDRAQALSDDLSFMVEHGERIANRLESGPDRRRSGGEADAEDRPDVPAPPLSSASAAPETGGDAGDGTRGYRSEIEQALAEVIRSTAAAG